VRAALRAGARVRDRSGRGIALVVRRAQKALLALRPRAASGRQRASALPAAQGGVYNCLLDISEQSAAASMAQRLDISERRRQHGAAAPRTTQRLKGGAAAGARAGGRTGHRQPAASLREQ